ncbi:Protein RTM1 [Fusarium oxysporum f. sp. cubense race 1]|uniref:Protein RTM1 n=1 Tax=Fusarium oxysporum f. sp. cubense (strain race 1) TaxID=1229664 RepID=N4UVZ9_FUSC1|nr:Protein RTM1 [Fusarium oxysporum f. sp. cubense race 1]
MVNYYRYEPSLPASIIFIVIFALSSALHLFQIIKTRTWFFSPFLVGSIFETVGFIGRAIGAEQAPDYTFGPYVLQTLLLLLGPTCYAASIYMILGRYIRQLKGEQFSLIRPSWLTKIFLLGDVISIALQGIGGGKLVSADTPNDRTKAENIIIGGLIVQCDENRPFCKNCIRKEALCEYFDTKSGSRGCSANNVKILPVSYQSPVEVEPILPISPASSNLSSSDLFAGRTGSPAEQLLERQLLHHFVQMTQRATDIQATWSLWILEQATHSPCVLNGILGISAFHLRRFNEFDKALEVASHEYMACAIEGHRKDLRSGMSKGNSSSVAAVCALVSIHANVNGYYLAGENDERMPHDWFISFRSSMNLLHTASPLIENPTVSQEFKTIHPTIDKTTHPNPFSFLLYYNPTSTDINQEEVSICMPAVAYLSYIYAEMTTRKPLRFPAALSAKFIDLIKAKNPRALAISGYFFMVVRQGRQLWLIDGAPEREFDTIMRCLPREWWSVMDWAVRVLGWVDRRAE